MRVFALATKIAELRMGRIISLWGPYPSLKSGAKNDPSCRTSVGLGGLMGGSCRTAGYDSKRPCYLRSSYIVSGIF